MDKNKLEVSGKESNDTPSLNATYKPIPETEYMEDQALARLNNHTKNHNNGPEADGAHEKMLPDDDTKMPHNANMGVKIIPATLSPEKAIDGFTLDLKPSVVVGMGKDELMKYANDPFWVRLRWILFIGFWLLWAAMLVGAILIIIAAPKCDPPKPKTWWEVGPLTEVNPDISAEALTSLKQNGVKAVISDWPLDAYKSLDAHSEFKDFLERAKGVDMNVIVGLEPGASSVYFNDSESKADAYTNSYIWQQDKNNWLTPSDTSAWSYSDIRGQYYYAPFGKPWVNFRDVQMQEEFSKVITRFLDAGAKGIRLSKAPYLLVDESFKDESDSGDATNATVGQYDFYNHHRTKDLPELAPLLKTWRDIVKNKTDNGPFMLLEDLTTLSPYTVNKSLVIDLPRHSQAFNEKMVSGLQIKRALDSANQTLEGNWAVWQTGNTGLDDEVLDMVTLLMPGTRIIPPSHTIPADLLSTRASASIMHGSFQSFAVANNTVYAFIRVTPSNPGYLMALNPTDETVKVDLPRATGDRVQDEVTVNYLSKSYGNITDYKVKEKISSKSLVIPSKAAIVLTYVPKVE